MCSETDGNQWLTEVQALEQMEAFIKKRIGETYISIGKTEGIENKLDWGSLLAYEDVLDEIQIKLGRWILDIK